MPHYLSFTSNVVARSLWDRVPAQFAYPSHSSFRSLISTVFASLVPLLPRLGMFCRTMHNGPKPAAYEKVDTQSQNARGYCPSARSVALAMVQRKVPSARCSTNTGYSGPEHRQAAGVHMPRLLIPLPSTQWGRRLQIWQAGAYQVKPTARSSRPRPGQNSPRKG